LDRPLESLECTVVLDIFLRLGNIPYKIGLGLCGVLVHSRCFPDLIPDCLPFYGSCLHVEFISIEHSSLRFNAGESQYVVGLPSTSMRSSIIGMGVLLPLDCPAACRPFISRLPTEAIVMVLVCSAGFGFGLLVFS